MNKTLEEQRRHFDDIAPRYLSMLGGTKLHDYYQKMGCDYLFTVLKRYYRDFQALTGLELGSGIGMTTAYLAQTTGAMHGVDFSPGMVAEATRRYGALFTEAPFSALPFPDASFDFVTSFGTFHHLCTIEEYRNAVQETHRILKPGGIIAISDINPWNPLTKVIAHSQDIDIGTERFFSRREVLPVFRTGGFPDVSMLDYGYIPHFLSFLGRWDGVFSRLRVPIGRYQMFIGQRRR